MSLLKQKPIAAVTSRNDVNQSTVCPILSVAGGIFEV